MVAARLCCRGCAPRAPPLSSRRRRGAARRRGAHRPHPGGRQFDRQRQRRRAAGRSRPPRRPARGRGRSPGGWPGPVGEQFGGPPRGSGGTGRIRSPSMPSASRLVASTDTRGQCRTIRSTIRAAASRTCSQLSTTSSSSRPRRYSITVCSMPRPCCCCTPAPPPPRGPPRHRRPAARVRTATPRRGSAPVAARGLEGKPGLADSTDAGQGDQRTLARSGRDARTSRSRPMKLRRAARQVRRGGRRSSAAADGAGRGMALARSLSRICWCTCAAAGRGRRRAPRRAAGASADRCRARRPAGRCGTGRASADPPDVRRADERAARGELAEQLGVSPCGSAASLRSSTAESRSASSAVRTSSDPRGVERGERVPPPQVERLVEQGCGFGRVGRSSGPAATRCRKRCRSTVSGSSARSRPARGQSARSRAGQQPAQSGHVARQSVAGPVRRLVRPHPIYELLHWDRPAYVDQQRDETHRCRACPVSRRRPSSRASTSPSNRNSTAIRLQPSSAPRDVYVESPRQPCRAPIQCSRSCTISSSSW